MGVPLASTPGRSGGFRVQDGYWLPPLHLSTDEATAVLFALGSAENADGDSPLGNPHRSAREKIEGALPPDIRSAAGVAAGAIQVSRHHRSPDPSTAAAILAAIADKHWLHVTYRGLRGETARSILPRSLSVSSGKWYVRAVDAQRQAIRIFRLDRVIELRRTIAPVDACATVERALREDDAYRASSNPEVVVQLTETGHALASDHPDFHQWVSPVPGGAVLRFHCPEHELDYYSRELLRFGLEARILAPSTLSQRVVEQAESTLVHHRQSIPMDVSWNDEGVMQEVVRRHTLFLDRHPEWSEGSPRAVERSGTRAHSTPGRSGGAPHARRG
jgi:predicted DNA-binding transcriptional regulator YafY